MVEGEDAKCFWLVHVLNSVGFGLFCAWPYCLLVPMAFGPSAGTSNGADYRFFTVGATLLVYLAILALRRTALKDRIQSPVVQGVGALLAAVGALLMALDGDVISPRGSAGAAFAGAGSAVLSIGWCARLSGRDEIDVDFVVAAASSWPWSSPWARCISPKAACCFSGLRSRSRLLRFLLQAFKVKHCAPRLTARAHCVPKRSTH